MLSTSYTQPKPSLYTLSSFYCSSESTVELHQQHLVSRPDLQQVGGLVFGSEASGTLSKHVSFALSKLHSTLRCRLLLRSSTATNHRNCRLSQCIGSQLLLGCIMMSSQTSCCSLVVHVPCSCTCCLFAAAVIAATTAAPCPCFETLIEAHLGRPYCFVVRRSAMVQQLLPWDTLFLAGFAYSGYRTLGRWLKYTDDVAKSQSGAIVILLLSRC